MQPIRFRYRQSSTPGACKQFFLFILGTLLLGACLSPGVPGLEERLIISSRSVQVTSFPAYHPDQPVSQTSSPSPILPTFTPPATVTSSPEPTLLPTLPAETRLLFTGIISPSRCVQAALDEKGNPNYPYEEVRQVILEADLAIGTFNAVMSDYPPMRGCVRTYVLLSRSNHADALKWAGFDVMNLATNHIKDCGVPGCGDRTFQDTLENLQRVGILTVGAGEDHHAALQPLVVTINGVRFGFVALGQINPRVFAGADQPGIAVLDEENLKKAINSAKSLADVVIAMPHWGPEDSAKPSWIQRGLAQKLVEAGADLVIGNHTHVIQAIQQINGIPVFYGLGNFVFDQGLPDHRQGVILIIKFSGKEYTGYELIPTHVDGDGRVHLASEKEAKEILERIEQISLELR